MKVRAGSESGPVHFKINKNLLWGKKFLKKLSGDLDIHERTEKNGCAKQHLMRLGREPMTFYPMLSLIY